MWGALSDERMDLSFTVAANPRQHSHSRVRLARSRDHIRILLYCIRGFPNPEVQAPSPVFISHRNRVIQLYSQALGSHFVTDSQGYGGSIRTCLQAGIKSTQVILGPSRSHVTTDGHSASMSRFRAHCGTCDQILLSVRRLSESFCLVCVGCPLWREVDGLALLITTLRRLHRIQCSSVV
jgi:hypothetical protein